MTKDLRTSFTEETSQCTQGHTPASVDPYAKLAALAGNYHKIAGIESLKGSGYSLPQIAAILELKK